MLMKRQLFLAGISLILGGMPMLAQDISSVNSVSYEWKSVPIVGGGFVDGIVFHPEAPGVRYCRTVIIPYIFAVFILFEFIYK